MTSRLTAWVLGAVALSAILWLAGQAAWQQSFTTDEPYHLAAGRQALVHGWNTLNLEHPPLVKLVAAQPWAAAEPGPPTRVRGAIQWSQEQLFARPEIARQVHRRSRLLLLVLFGLPFLAAAGWLGRELVDGKAGLTLAALLGLSFAVLPHLPLAQTDTAVSLGYALALAAGVSWLLRGGWGRLAVAGLGGGLAVAAKYSGVLVLPAVLLLPWLPAPGPRRSIGQRLLATALLAALVIAPAWASYSYANRHYEAEEGQRTIRLYAHSLGTLRVEKHMEPWQPRLMALEERHPLIAQWATGFVGIRIQDELGTYPSYVFGRMDSNGRAWFYPFVLLVKTPLVLWIATLAALTALAVLIGGRRHRRALLDRLRATRDDRSWVLWVPPGITLVVYLAAAVTSSYNIGSRHLLPILPLLYLPAAWWLSRRWARLVPALLLLAIEAFVLAPNWIPATNTWFLGNANPTRFALCCSDGEYNQGLIALRQEARQRGIEDLGVLRPGTSAAQLRLHLPNAHIVDPGSPVASGWYAVSVLVEEGVPAIEGAGPETLYSYELYRELAAGWRETWDLIRRGEDHGWVAGSFHLYRVPEP